MLLYREQGRLPALPSSLNPDSCLSRTIPVIVLPFLFLFSCVLQLLVESRCGERGGNPQHTTHSIYQHLGEAEAD